MLRATIDNPYASAAPIHLLNAVMFWAASGTLTGRRRGERAADEAGEGLHVVDDLHSRHGWSGSSSAMTAASAPTAFEISKVTA